MQPFLDKTLAREALVKRALVWGARSSPLSRVQVEEVLSELKEKGITLFCDFCWVETKGDKDLTTSLKGMEKSDFFTQEIDTLLLEGKIDVAIHSAKDLPEPLPPGLYLAAITKGVDSSDVLVLGEGKTLGNLQTGARIGVSSLRREENIKRLNRGFECVDIRGTIQRRLSLLDEGVVEAVVMAAAAMIRLKINRNCVRFEELSQEFIKSPFEFKTAPMQGKLAVVIREGDLFLKELFHCIDSEER